MPFDPDRFAPPVPADEASAKVAALQTQNALKSVGKWGLGLVPRWAGMATGAGEDLGRLAMAASSAALHGVGSAMGASDEWLAERKRVAREIGGGSKAVQMLETGDKMREDSLKHGYYNAIRQSAENMSSGLVDLGANALNLKPTGYERLGTGVSMVADFMGGRETGAGFAAGATAGNLQVARGLLTDPVNQVMGDPFGTAFSLVDLKGLRGKMTPTEWSGWRKRYGERINQWMDAKPRIDPRSTDPLYTQTDAEPSPSAKQDAAAVATEAKMANGEMPVPEHGAQAATTANTVGAPPKLTPTQQATRAAWAAIKGAGYSADMLGLTGGALVGLGIEYAPQMAHALLGAGWTSRQVAKALDSAKFKADPEKALADAKQFIAEKEAATKRLFIDRSATTNPTATAMGRSQFDEPHRVNAAAENLGDELGHRIATDETAPVLQTGEDVPTLEQRAGIQRVVQINEGGEVTAEPAAAAARLKMMTDRELAMKDLSALNDRLAVLLKDQRAKMLTFPLDANGNRVVPAEAHNQMAALSKGIKRTRQQMQEVAATLPENTPTVPVKPPTVAEVPGVTEDSPVARPLPKDDAGAQQTPEVSPQDSAEANTLFPPWEDRGDSSFRAGDEFERRSGDEAAPQDSNVLNQVEPNDVPEPMWATREGRFAEQDQRQRAESEARRTGEQMPEPEPPPPPRSHFPEDPNQRRPQAAEPHETPVRAAKLRDDAVGADLSLREATLQAARAKLDAIQHENAADLAFDPVTDAPLPNQKALLEAAHAKVEIADLAETYANALRRVKDLAEQLDEEIDDHARVAGEVLNAAAERRQPNLPDLVSQADRSALDAAVTRAAKIRAELERATQKAPPPGAVLGVWTDFAAEQLHDLENWVRRMHPDALNDFLSSTDHQAAGPGYNGTAFGKRMPIVTPEYLRADPANVPKPAPGEGPAAKTEAKPESPDFDPAEPQLELPGTVKKGWAKFVDDFGPDIEWMRSTYKSIGEIAWDANIPEALVKRYHEVMKLEPIIKKPGEFERLYGDKLKRLEKLMERTEQDKVRLADLEREIQMAEHEAKKERRTQDLEEIFFNRQMRDMETGWDPRQLTKKVPDLNATGAARRGVLKGQDLEATLGRKAGQWTPTAPDKRSWRTNNKDVNDLVDAIVANAEGKLRLAGPIKMKVDPEAVKAELTEVLVDNSILLARDDNFRASLVGRLKAMLGLNEKQVYGLDKKLKAEAQRDRKSRASELTVVMTNVKVDLDKVLGFLQETEGKKVEGKNKAAAVLDKADPQVALRVLNSLSKSIGYEKIGRSPLPKEVAKVLYPAVYEWSKGGDGKVVLPTLPIDIRAAIGEASIALAKKGRLRAIQGELARSVAFQIGDEAQSNAILASIDTEQSRYVGALSRGDQAATAIEMAGRMLAGEVGPQVWIGDNMRPANISEQLRTFANELEAAADARNPSGIQKILAVAEAHGWKPEGEVSIKQARKLIRDLADSIERDVKPINIQSLQALIAQSADYADKFKAGSMYATPSYAAVLERQVANLTYSRQLDSFSRNLNRVLSANVTTFSPAGLVANFVGALTVVSQITGKGPLGTLQAVVKSYNWLEDGRRGKLSTVDQAIHRAMVQTGAMDTGRFEGEIAAIGMTAQAVGLEAPNAYAKVTHALSTIKILETMQTLYRKNDPAWKAVLGKRAIDRVISELRMIEVDEPYYMHLTDEQTVKVRRIDKGLYRVEGPRGNYTADIPAANSEYVSGDAKRFLNDIASHAMLGPKAALFDYVDVPNIVEKARAVPGLGNSFMTFSYKALSAPGKLGLFDHVLNYENLHAGQTNSPKVNAARADAQLKLALRRIVMHQGQLGAMRANGQPTNRDERVAASGKDPVKAQASIVSDSLIPGMGYVADYSSSNYLESTDRMMRVATAAVVWPYINANSLKSTDDFAKKSPKERAEINAYNAAITRIISGQQASLDDALVLAGLGGGVIGKIIDWAQARTPDEKTQAFANGIQGVGSVILPGFIAAGLDFGIGAIDPSSAFSTRQPKAKFNLEPEDAGRHLMMVLTRLLARRFVTKGNVDDFFDKLETAAIEGATGLETIRAEKFEVASRATRKVARAGAVDLADDVSADREELKHGNKVIGTKERLIGKAIQEIRKEVKRELKDEDAYQNEPTPAPEPELEGETEGEEVDFESLFDSKKPKDDSLSK
jgi:hypothetical protein